MLGIDGAVAGAKISPLEVRFAAVLMQSAE